MKIEIEKVDNGYIFRGNEILKILKVFATIEEVFAEILDWAEGRRDWMGGKSYGKVVVERNDPSQAFMPTPMTTDG